MLKQKRTLIIAGAVIVGLIIIFSIAGAGSGSGSEIVVKVEKGEFVVDVNTTGELEAKNSVDIMGPAGLRNYRIWQVNLQHIIDEGTYVRKGDYVAALDPMELKNRMSDTQLEVDQKESQYIQTQLDTTLQMREARDQLINLAYAVEEKKLVLEQSKYEPPATVKQAEIELDKAKRALKQNQESYEIRRKQNIAKMQEVTANLQKKRMEMQGMVDLEREFRISAPQDGMLIYKKGWDGKPLKAGSQIHAFEPAVATLPDLSSMNSVTYVNEVDIRKITVGQKVDIGLDAFPDKKLTGIVRRVANVGEQRPNSDAKVFMVTIELDNVDETLRPGMTTSNKIYTSVINETLFVPLECLHNFADSITYVYRQGDIGYAKQEVQVGQTNANYAEILLGLKLDDKLYLSIPQDKGGEIDLLEELNGKRKLQKEEEKQPDAPQPEFGQGGKQGGKKNRPNT